MKIEKKLTNWLWFIIRLFPFLYVLMFVLGMSNTLIADETVYSVQIYQQLFEGVVSEIIFMPVAMPLTQIFATIIGSTVLPKLVQGIIAYVSYLVFVELLRFLYIIFTIIFNLMRNWIEGWV